MSIHITGLFLLIFGLVYLIGAKYFAIKTVNFQKKFFRKNYSLQDFNLFFRILGTLFCILGILTLLGFKIFKN